MSMMAMELDQRMELVFVGARGCKELLDGRCAELNDSVYHREDQRFCNERLDRELKVLQDHIMDLRKCIKGEL